MRSLRTRSRSASEITDLHRLMSTTTLYRPVAQKELELIEASGWKAFPPQLPEQPIFYPVTNLADARQITQEWSVPAYGIGHVLRFAVESDYLRKFPVENVGGRIHDELWVPAEELDAFNAHMSPRTPRPPGPWRPKAPPDLRFPAACLLFSNTSVRWAAYG